MSTFVRGHETGEWQTAADMLRRVEAVGKNEDAVSNRVSRMLSDAWDGR